MSDRNRDPPSLTKVFIETLKSLVSGESQMSRGSSGSNITMEDVNYLIDMDGAGLCFHEIYKSNKAFKK